VTWETEDGETVEDEHELPCRECPSVLSGFGDGNTEINIAEDLRRSFPDFSMEDAGRKQKGSALLDVGKGGGDSVEFAEGETQKIDARKRQGKEKEAIVFREMGLNVGVDYSSDEVDGEEKKGKEKSAVLRGDDSFEEEREKEVHRTRVKGVDGIGCSSDGEERKKGIRVRRRVRDGEDYSDGEEGRGVQRSVYGKGREGVGYSSEGEEKKKGGYRKRRDKNEGD
jgi:hypothetical protein